MYLFVEEKIKQAVEKGEFDKLPGMGKPLDLTDDLPGLSPELKMGYKMLKNAGYISDNQDIKNENITIQELLSYATDGMEKDEFQKRLEFGEFVKKRNLHTNSKFSIYAKKIYRKIFLRVEDR
jgi:hypothetical protein